jgi:hypothetical protein
MYLKSIDLGHSIVHLLSDGIIQVNFGDSTELDLKETVEIVETIGVLTEGKKALILNIAGKNTSATSAARVYSASVSGLKYTLADAFVVTNLAQKILGNFYMSFNKPLVSTRIFDDQEKATAWLKGLL